MDRLDPLDHRDRDDRTDETDACETEGRRTVVRVQRVCGRAVLSVSHAYTLSPYDAERRRETGVSAFLRQGWCHRTCNLRNASDGA
jgi:hypothetical protein